MTPVYIALTCVGAALFAAMAVLFAYLSNNLISVSRYTVESEKIRAEGVCVVQISDLHGKRFGKGNKRLFAKVTSLSPDVIAITGDVIHRYDEKNIAAATEAVAGLSKIAPVLYVSGNHEMRSKRYRQLRSELASCGAVVLDNAEWQGLGLCVCGVNCADIKKGKFFALAKSEEKFNLLLAHLPQYINRYSSAGYDCVLCGHAHGGQWRLPFTGVGLYAPGQGLFPKYCGGKHVCGDTSEIISRGLGNSRFPLRLFNRPEIVVIDLKKSL